ncbi:DivIVA domain-containing protein [Desulfitobacterium sp.]|uniref:DivIVA domain-containing protein n=1 Tax=Desulfitobacterium sp. TaxID=49981 RepID=UPI002C57727B|nr:DivIVA domain-containing protein [Desulfitobacterium sp.]HVJ48133.1 DivIVA domain-containing protein [Desulfitobacterium sp.]
MNYTPDDLESINFNKILIGYSKNQVDEMLTKIISDYSDYNNITNEINELKSRISVLDEIVQHYKSIEESLQHSVIIAHHTSNTIKESACEKAKTIIEEAETTARKLVNDANQEVNKINFEYEGIKRKLYTFKTKSEALLYSQLEVLEQLSDK